ncbi:unnamed protein product [Strongylus vulgaris]|uniref:Uncharacterized protein n=1 Tax=Strongylus vulgaris TaxID=40348 RepID=A0A3P7J9D7_STRVU|nr:unnamed protein product [Strongylus vulgaris]
MEYHGSDEEEMVVADEDDGELVTYFVEDAENPGNLLEVVHSERAVECESPPASSKVAPLLMEPQPTGNLSFDETMCDIKRRINILQEQKRQTRNAERLSMLVTQIRDLQGQLVRNVPQTNGFIQATEQEFDGEEDDEEVRYERIEGDDAVCLEIEVESTEAPSKPGTSGLADHYEELGFEAEPYEEVVTAGYQF